MTDATQPDATKPDLTAGPQRRLAGIHHLKLAASNLDASLAWWEQVFAAKRQAQWDHRTPAGDLFAYLLVVPGLDPLVELRLDPVAARSSAGFDPVTFAVETEGDLRLWSAELSALGIAHSPVLRGIVSWLLVVQDPDGTFVRLYARQTHEWDPEHADYDREWGTALPPPGPDA